MTYYTIFSNLQVQVILDDFMEAVIVDTWQYHNTSLQLFHMSCGLKLLFGYFPAGSDFWHFDNIIIYLSFHISIIDICDLQAKVSISCSLAICLTITQVFNHFLWPAGSSYFWIFSCGLWFLTFWQYHNIYRLSIYLWPESYHNQ